MTHHTPDGSHDVTGRSLPVQHVCSRHGTYCLVLEMRCSCGAHWSEQCGERIRVRPKAQA